MQVPNYFSKVAIVMLFLLPGLTRAQVVSKEQKTEAIQLIAQHIAANYVYAEEGGQIASHIQQANFRGDFDKSGSWQEFDEQVTAAIRKVSKDQHLYVRYDPEQASRLSGSTGDANRMYIPNTDQNNNTAVVAESRVLSNNIGYLKLASLNIDEAAFEKISEAMRSFANTTSLIIDLRDNSGGSSQFSAVFQGMFVAAGTPLLEFTSRAGETTKLNAAKSDLAYDKPVYILVNKNTASAAEAFAFTLQELQRAKIAGETTSGAAFMNRWFPVGDHSYVSVSTSVAHLPGKERNWHLAGVRPDIKIKGADALSALAKKIAAGA